MKEIFYIPRSKEKPFYKLKDNFIKKESSLKYSKKNFYTTFVKSKDIIHTPLEIESSIPEDSIEDYISAKTYEELGLDFNIEYIIKYIKKENSNTIDMDEYDVFALSVSNVQNTFNEQTKEVKHIDYIGASPFLIQPLYKLEILEKNTIDCFIYLSMNDSFLSIYKNGEFLYFKAMEFSLEELFKKFTFVHPNVIKIENFIDILLGAENDKYKDDVNDLYNDFGVYISDILLYVKRVYSIEIDNLYLDSEISLKDEFYVYFNTYVDVETQKFDFDYKLVGETPHHLIKLMFLSAQIFLEQKSDFNFTIFKKEKSIFLKSSGKFIIATISGLLFSLLYPLFNYIYGLIIEEENKSLNQTVMALDINVTRFKILLSQLEGKKIKADKKLNLSNKRLKNIEVLIDEIKKKRLSYFIKSNILIELTGFINNHNIDILDFNIFTGSEISLKIESYDEEEITNFINDVDKKYTVAVEKISLNDEDLLYTSEINLKKR